MSNDGPLKVVTGAGPEVTPAIPQPPPPPPVSAIVANNSLERQIIDILGAADPLDAADFDPIDHINAMFPTEQSFSAVDSITAKLRKQVEAMDRNISSVLREQTEREADAGHAELEHAKAAIQALSQEITTIKSKARHAEKTVQDITKDIKSLDCAKKNLTNSITVLRRLQMLGSAVDQLRAMVSKRQYHEVAALLQATQELSANFTTYRNIKQISELLGSIAAIQADLKRMIFSDFEGSFTQQGAFTGKPNALQDACLVADFLDVDTKKQLLDWYCELQLRDYRYSFSNNDDLGGLDNVARRYAWLKRVCKTYDEEQATIFPSSWNVSEIVCARFCDITRDNLGAILAKMGTVDVKVLIKSLQMTLDFESGLNRRFTTVQSNTATNEVSMDASVMFSGKISIAYEPYMKYYIEAEDKTLAGMVEKFKTSTVVSEEDYQTGVFTSSTDLFYFYRQNLVAMAKLNTGKPFLDLSKLFGKWLAVYCEVLNSKLPKEEKRPSTLTEMKLTCLIMNTAEYCQNTSSQLEEKIKEKIDEPFRVHVDLGKERDTFLMLSTSAIQTLVRQVNSCLYGAFQSMAKIPWASMSTVGDQSEYVTIIGSTLSSNVVQIRKSITNAKHFKWFCDKFVDFFVPWYLKSITNCKPISEVGAEQMLLDSLSLKTILLEIPNMGADERHPPPATFTTFVTKGVAKAEMLLKAVLTPLEPPEMMIKNYLILASSELGDVNDPSSVTPQKVTELRETFVKILDLKGVKRSDQLPLVDMLMNRISKMNLPMPSLGTGSTASASKTSPTVVPLAASGFSSLASGMASISVGGGASTINTGTTAASTASGASQAAAGSMRDAGAKLNENFKRFTAAMDIKGGWLKK